ncbi:VOC family protein [Mycobacterium sp. URHB0044]|uniref:VOC family protein n=1 Tax=Mycobacterium sp. URHB0044 TaxID=1380386 RepID=UPI00048C4BAE|nr:VOC family protein [Mycobacterium sp. URHB0044]
MSKFFGGIRQNGYVVTDLDAAIRHWTTVVGVGPFYRLDHVPLDYFTYHGEPSAPDLNIALANLGDVQIELIQQLNDAPSPWRNFSLAKGAGLHHVSGWTQTYDGDLKRLDELGLIPTCEGSIAGAARFAYFLADNVDGTAIEVADLTSPEFTQLFEHIRRSAVSWDGSDPVCDLFATLAGVQAS